MNDHPECNRSLFQTLSPDRRGDATHSPIVITGRRGNAVLISEEDWNAINETLYLISITGMRESIREGMTFSLEECDEDAGW